MWINCWKIFVIKKEKNIKANYYGIDVSKDAVKYAGKTNKDCVWAVGNNFNILAGDKSIDCILSVFSPIDIDECNRVLKDDGIFVRVLPRTNHLIQLRNIIYSEVHLNEKVYKADAYENEYIKESNVTFDITLNKEEVLSWQDFIDLGLVGNKDLRFQVCEDFHIGPCNAKTCFKRLNQMNVTKEEIEERSLSWNRRLRQ